MMSSLSLHRARTVKIFFFGEELIVEHTKLNRQKLCLVECPNLLISLFLRHCAN